jgi:hypothetical protein
LVASIYGMSSIKNLYRGHAIDDCSRTVK